MKIHRLSQKSLISFRDKNVFTVYVFIYICRISSIKEFSQIQIIELVEFQLLFCNRTFLLLIQRHQKRIILLLKNIEIYGTN